MKKTAPFRPFSALALVTAGVLALAAGSVRSLADDKKMDPGATPAVTPVDPGSPAAMNGPKLETEKSSFELGVIGDDKEVESVIKFKNSGVSPLEIKETKGSCGCTVPTLEKKVYAPGEEGEVKVKYNPHNRNGKQSTKVTIVSNDPVRPSVELSVNSEVRPLMRVEPAMLQMGQLGKGEAGKPQMFTVISRLPDVKVTQVTPATPKISTKVGETVEVEENGEKLQKTTVEVTLAADAQVGQVNENLTIRTSDPARVLNMYVMGEVLGNFTAAPAQVTLNQLAPGQDVKQMFRVSSRSGKPFRVLEVIEKPGSGSPMFAFAAKEDASVTPAGYVVDITGKAPMNPGAMRGDIIVKTDLADEPEFTVKYFGFVRPSQSAQTEKTAWEDHPSSLVPVK